jgi:lysine/ornithine N-monooxygenase
MPPALEGFSRELISYSAEHRDLSRFAQKDVTIVGRGQSALETAALLHEQGTNVRVLARAGQFEWGADPNLPLSALERVRNPMLRSAQAGAAYLPLSSQEYSDIYLRKLVMILS